MPEADVKADDKKQDAPEGAEPQQKEPDVKTDEGPKTLEEAMAAIAKMSEQMTKDADLLKKVRKYEKENKERADAALKEQGKYKELYDAELVKRQELETKVRDSFLTGAIEKALKERAASPTVMRLIDRSKIVVENDVVDATSILSQLDELKKTDPALFGAVTKVPDVKRPGEGDPTGGYEKELRAAKSQKEIDAVLKKYGKM